ncbi:MAG: GTP-binding protein, partial [Clostridium sp.]|nr:GTP-binding protein [Clostridium sp.]
MNKTIGVLAHVDAGKTTFCEQVLYHTNSIRKRGRVDSKDAFLDNHNIERQRGITIFSEQGIFTYNKSKYYLVDTPGHIDFSPEMERAISIMDYAVVIISAVEKIQSHTKTVFRLLNKYKVPTIFFVNKIDRVGADIDGVIKDIKNNLTTDVINITDDLNIKQNNIILKQNFIEFIAERDEVLFEKYLDDNYDEKLWIDTMKKMIKDCKLYPLMYGSALNDIGIKEFIKKLDFLTETSYSEEKGFMGKVFKIRHDENKNKITYLKVLQGSLKVKDEVCYKYKEQIIKEKVNEIRVYNSNKYNVVNEAKAGEIVCLTGLNYTFPQEYIISKELEQAEILNTKTKNEMIPTLKSKVIFDDNLNIKDVLNAFNILNNEEPALNVIWQEDLKEIHIHVMGKIQLEILKEVIKERFDTHVEFGPCEILYKETISKEVIGCAHFEPLGHYSEVHIKIEPTSRNSEISFESKAHVDDL